jgi:drug/metabolite transporter (DMT)-like permease
MSTNALWGLVLFSAVAHAAWNSLVKSAGDRVATMVTIRVVGLGLGLMALPFAAWPDEEPWKWLALTAFIQFGYYAFLVRSYGLGDMSVVYPLARGTAPLLTTVGAFIALDKRLSMAHFAAIALISIGIMMLSIGSGASRPALGFASATGLSVAGYSLVRWRGRSDGWYGGGIPGLPGNHDDLAGGRVISIRYGASILPPSYSEPGRPP